MANELQNKSPADTYKDVLHLGTATTSTPGTGLPATTVQTVYDGEGNPSKLKLSQSQIEADTINITNGTITSLATPLAFADGGTGGSTVSAVKVLWSIDNVENIALSTWTGSSNITTVGAITSGSWGGTEIPIAKGGTGGTSEAAVKTLWSIEKVENTAISTWVGSSNITTVGTIVSGIWEGTTIPISKGGTGAITNTAARTNLGLGTLATQSSGAVTITGGNVSNITLTNPTITSPTITSLTSITAGNITLSGSTIQNSISGNTINSPYFNAGVLGSDTASIQRVAGSAAGIATVQISQLGTETEDLLVISDPNAVTKTKVKSSGALVSNQLGADKFIECRASESTSLSGTFSVYTADKTLVTSHSASFTSANIAVGDIIRIKATAGGTWETREVISRISDSSIKLGQELTNTYASTSLLERAASSSSSKFEVANNGSPSIAGGAWNSGHLVMGAYHIWVDSTGNLRIKNSAPSSDTDGTIVGTQS